MFFIIYFLLFTLTYTHKCSFKYPIKYEHVYLCREKLNSTSIRIWLHIKLNKTKYEENFLLYYTFTLRIIDLIDKHKIHFKDYFEKQISNYTEINLNKQENNTINIHNLLPGRYEICVNFLNNKNTQFYYRTMNSCLHIPWKVSESEQDQPNLHDVLLLISIIILLVVIVFFVYIVHQYVKSRKSPIIIENIDEAHEKDKDSENSERARLLVNQHFTPNVNPFELLVRRRIHQRYAHQSPDLNDM